MGEREERIPDQGTAFWADSLRCLTDTLWRVDVERNQVRIFHDTLYPGLRNTDMEYAELAALVLEKHVYRDDRETWRRELGLEGLRAFMRGPGTDKRLEIRLVGDTVGFTWHEVFMRKVTDRAGDPPCLALVSRNIADWKRASLIEAAVREEYDYVVYVEADSNSYIMYSANHASGTPLPPAVGLDYTAEMLAYNKCRDYCEEEEGERLCREMSLDTVRARMAEGDEYVLYCRVRENGRLAHKKLRFSCFDRERHIFLLTRTDITEAREEARQKELLRDALAAATAAGKAKSEFLARMSHDIRTPMNAIIGMTAIAGSHLDERDRVADCLGKIAGASRLLLGLINEILDMSRLESGRLALAEEEFDLGEVLQDLLMMLQADIAAKRHRLDVHVFGVEHERVAGDPQRLKQVLMNVLSNAIKYTPEGGRIVLDIRETAPRRSGPAGYEFVVTDNGWGMKPDFLESIFEPFERADDPRVRAVQGTGLGMAISRNIARMMGGDIRVESEYGRGSRFTVTLLLRPCGRERGDAPALPRLPVLVVDDDRVVCEGTCASLTALGLDGEWVLSGAEAVARVVERHQADEDYFAALIDLRMPGMDGLETTRRIRAAVGPKVPIIILSAYDTAEYEIEARRAGADGFVSKPLFTSRLDYVLRAFALGEKVARPAPVPGPVPAKYAGRRALLVEDNLLNREIAAEIIGGTGVRIEVAGNGREAVDMVAASPPGYYDLIFMDIQMPVMDGYAATRAIRALDRPDAAALPIFAMTANAFPEDVARALKEGMNLHLAKPLDIGRLMAVLEEWLAPGRGA